MTQEKIVLGNSPGLQGQSSAIEDEHLMTPFAKKVLLFVFVAWIFDAADGAIYSMTLPLIRAELGLTLPQMGLIGSFFLGGAFIGSILLPYLADRKGRRWGMAACIGLYSVFSGFTGIAQNFNQVAAARFFTGWGTGGEWPVGAAYLSEVVPAKKRGFAMGLMQSGYPIGYFLAAGLFAAFMAWGLGWRACYFVLVIPAILCFLVLSNLKESNRWQSKRQAASGAEAPKVNYWELFRPEYRRFTIVCTLLHICAGFYGWGLAIWFPSILMLDFKVPAVTTSYIVMFMWVPAYFAYVIGGRLADKIGRKPTMAIFATAFLIGVGSLNYLKTLSGVDVTTLAIIATLIGCGHGYNTVLITYTGEIFPSHVRSMGAGFAVAIGKAAAFMAPFALGVISQYYSISVGLMVGAIVGWMMVPLMLLGPETAQKRLEEIVS